MDPAISRRRMTNEMAHNDKYRSCAVVISRQVSIKYLRIFIKISQSLKLLRNDKCGRMTEDEDRG